MVSGITPAPIPPELAQLRAAFLRRPEIFRRVKMLTEEQAANAYEAATDGCRRSVLGTQDDARHERRVKPDEEVHPLAELDYEEGATWDELVFTTPELVRRTGSIGIQSPIGKNRAAAM